VLPEKVTQEEFEKLPEVVRDHYAEDKASGEYRLSLVPKAKLDEFRSNNISLLRERDELKAVADKFKDIDPEKAREALAKISKIDEKKMMDEGKVEEIFNQRTEALRKEAATKLKAAEDERDSLNTRLSTVLIDNAIASEALKDDVGVLPKATELVVRLARDVWKIGKEGKPVAVGKDGQQIYGKDGNPITMHEWLIGLQATHEYLFAKSGGGSASNDKPAPNSSKPRSKMTIAERSAYIDKHGKDAYEKLSYN
jgi:hypothetical protein